MPATCVLSQCLLNVVKALSTIVEQLVTFLTYQLSLVRYWRTEAVTGNGELGFDSGEGA
jgi:hypothetical protein